MGQEASYGGFFVQYKEILAKEFSKEMRPVCEYLTAESEVSWYIKGRIYRLKPLILFI